MKQNYSLLVGKVCQVPDGEHVLVETVGEGDTGARAIVRLIDGPKKHTRRVYFASSLQPVEVTDNHA